MKRILVIAIAGATLAPTAWAQVPPALRSADPSQQLKSAGIGTSPSARDIANLSRPIVPDEPLIRVVEPLNGTIPGNHIVGAPVPAEKPRPADDNARMQRIRALIELLRHAR